MQYLAKESITVGAGTDKVRGKLLNIFLIPMRSINLSTQL
jgi:hypothetical protein